MKQFSESSDILDVQNNLIILSQKGDASAFGQLYDIYADRIFRFLIVKIGDRQEAEDLLQEVFIKVWRALPKFSLEQQTSGSNNFSSWVYRIASNTANDLLRKRYRSPEIATLDDYERTLTDSPRLEPEEMLSSKEQISLLQTAMEKLPPQHREILELRFIQGFSVPESAKICGRTELATRLLQHRALKKLRTILTKNLPI